MDYSSTSDIYMSKEEKFSAFRKYSSLSKRRLPRKIILIRHGESLGNVDEKAYTYIPDSRIPLTEKGRLQAVETGKRLRSIIAPDEPISIYTSPYIRTKQTLAGIMQSLTSNPIIGVREEPRLTEQQFGNFQTVDQMCNYKRDRSLFGRFYYRFPDGESGLDVFNRVSSFIGTLFREWKKMKEENVTHDKESTVIIVTHGLTLRLFLMRWFQFTVQEFEDSQNPTNGSIVVMHRKCDEDSNYLSSSSDDCEGWSEDKLTSDQYYLSEETLQYLNLPMASCNPRKYYDVKSTLELILKEAEDGYKIIDKLCSPKDVLPVPIPRVPTKQQVEANIWSKIDSGLV